MISVTPALACGASVASGVCEAIPPRQVGDTCTCVRCKCCFVSKTRLLAMSVVALLAFAILFAAPVAHAQGPTSQTDAAGKIVAIVRVLLDTLQGKATPDANALFQQSKQSATQFLNSPTADLFFLDFGNPNLPLNQFAANVARNLLALTPLYALAYLVILIYSIWRERPIPNPILFAALVAGVMIFLAAFAVISQGMSELGRALATALGGNRAAFLDTVLGTVVILQKNGGVIAPVILLVASVEMIVILIQLAYRGISMAIWRLLGVMLIPLSVLIENANPKTAGKVVSGFFEAWLDMVGKITLLMIALSLASADTFAKYIWFVLPASLLVVILSWKFFGVVFTLIRDAVARVWKDVVPARVESFDQLPAAAEAARAREIDEERRKLMEE
ncbi:hypothetical protein ANRL1_01647 [Anaerolineae bacterium]|nr:hypothetical protein ANRL1_01647 [Anaerolineae bacterium]